jgi:Bacterial SH3 domain
MNAAIKSLQLLLGLITGLIAIVGILGGAGYYFFVTQMSTRPPKPVFAEERNGGGKSIAAKPKAKTAIAAKPAQSPAVKDPQNPDQLPPEAYDAKVVWKDGLSLKKEPVAGAEKVGSVAFNAPVAVVKTSNDKQWVLIRSQADNAQGWVKAGNIDKAAAANEVTEEAPKPAAKPSVRRNRVRVRPQTDAENN